MRMSILKPFAVVLAIAIASMVVPSAGLSVVGAQSGGRTFVPVASNDCGLNEIFQTDSFSRYLLICKAPVVKKVVTISNHPELKIEWLSDENPLAISDGLAFAVPENALPVDKATLDVLRVIVKARAEAASTGVTNETQIKIEEVKEKVETGEISPSQVQLAVGLAFAGPPGWIAIAVIVLVTVAVVAYVVLSNPRIHTGVSIGELGNPQAHADYTFTLDGMEQAIAEGAETTTWLAQGRDAFLDGTAGRVAQRRQILTEAREIFSTGTNPKCEHRDDGQGGTTALWWTGRGNKPTLFLHRPADPRRDSAMYRPRIGSYPTSIRGGYVDLPDDDPECEDAREWLLWRVLCYLSGLNCDQPPSPFEIRRKLT